MKITSTRRNCSLERSPPFRAIFPLQILTEGSATRTISHKYWAKPKTEHLVFAMLCLNAIVYARVNSDIRQCDLNPKRIILLSRILCCGNHNLQAQKGT